MACAAGWRRGAIEYSTYEYKRTPCYRQMNPSTCVSFMRGSFSFNFREQANGEGEYFAPQLGRISHIASPAATRLDFSLPRTNKLFLTVVNGAPDAVSYDVTPFSYVQQGKSSRLHWRQMYHGYTDNVRGDTTPVSDQWSNPDAEPIIQECGQWSPDPIRRLVPQERGWEVGVYEKSTETYTRFTIICNAVEEVDSYPPSIDLPAHWTCSHSVAFGPDPFHVTLPVHSYCVPESRGPEEEHTAHGAACGGPEPGKQHPWHERRATQPPPHERGAAGADCFDPESRKYCSMAQFAPPHERHQYWAERDFQDLTRPRNTPPPPHERGGGGPRTQAVRASRKTPCSTSTR